MQPRTRRIASFIAEGSTWIFFALIAYVLVGTDWPAWLLPLALYISPG